MYLDDTFRVKVGLAEMLKGGVIMDVTNAEQALVARLAEAKQLADLHTDQLSQALLLRFAESGRLAAHKSRVLAAGAERLAAVLAACERSLPVGTRFTRPQVE